MKRKKLAVNPTVRNVLIGIAVGVAVIMLGSVVGAYMIYTETMELDGVGYISVAVMLAAAFLSSLIGGKGMVGKERLITGLVASVGFWVVLIGCNVAMFGGNMSGAGVTLLLVLGCSLSVFLLFGKRNTKRKFKIPKM